MKKKAQNIAGFDQLVLNGVIADRYVPPHRQNQAASEETVFLILHGGAYCIHLPNFYRVLLAKYCDALDCSGIMPDYRLMPEHPHPAGIDDCVNAYKALIDMGYKSQNIILYGDSAGGGLCLSVAQRIRDAGIAAPRCLVLVSPSGDWSLAKKSFYENEGKDPMFRVATLLFYRTQYLNGHSPEDPAVSPIYGDFAGFPPTLIFASTTELLRDIAVDAHAKIRGQGGSSELVLEPGLVHAFAMFDFLPEGKKAQRRIIEFCKERSNS